MSQEKKDITFVDRVNKFGDLFFLNLIFVLACIPVITIGAAIVAMYSYTIKLVDDEEDSSVWKSFWKYFSRNFKQATVAWLIILAIVAVIVGEYMLSFSLGGMAYSFVLALIALEAIYLSFVFPFIFPLIARYENTTANMFKNALIIPLVNLGTWFKLVFVWIIPILLYVLNEKVFYYSWYLWILILISVIAYASTMILRKLFDKLEEEEAEREAKKAAEKPEETKKSGAQGSRISMAINAMKELEETEESNEDENTEEIQDIEEIQNADASGDSDE